MALQPIVIQLSKFENIEILRQEILDRETELKNVEKQIRQILWEMERLRYLKSLHALFHELELPPEAHQLQQLQVRRESLDSALFAMKNALKILEAECAQASRGSAPAASVPTPGKSRFDSFDEFRKKKGEG